MSTMEPTLPGWSRLVETAMEPNPFFAPALAQAAMEHLGGGTVRLITTRSPDGGLAALAPVRAIRLGRVARAVSVWTHLYGPLGTPLVAAADAVADFVAAMDGKRAGAAVLVFPDLPLDGPVASALIAHAQAAGRPTAMLGVHRRAVLLRPSDPAVSVRDGIARKSRKEFGRQMRRLAEQGEIAMTWSPAASELDAFLALEASGWKGARGTAISRVPAAEAFLRAALAQMGDGDAMMSAIRRDGMPVAMVLVFRSRDLAVTWKIAHDEALARFSPGVQVMLEASDALMADPGLMRIDSLASADHPMIDRLWHDRIAIGTLVIGPRGGSPGFKLGLAAARAEIDMRHLARHALARWTVFRSRREVTP